MTKRGHGGQAFSEDDIHRFEVLISDLAAKVDRKVEIRLTELPIVRFNVGLHPYAVLYGVSGELATVAKFAALPFESELQFLDRINDLDVGDVLTGYGHVEVRRWKSSMGKNLSAAEVVIDVLSGPEKALPQMPEGVSFPKDLLRG
ncbi:hypothetical protein [Croceicoccus gelatinilyticus]|uniref:hypothetical protein n=1 Tax=Croceicoccus gelatinilyticus TaxID=2835536 RepID=UPI001BCAEF6F|nr:hypothetical protein [Croceicoccus gelatinilyticus]MBS7671734.1 hypothetical protein [Croceicoccus gelatinilyticus]